MRNSRLGILVLVVVFAGLFSLSSCSCPSCDFPYTRHVVQGVVFDSESGNPLTGAKVCLVDTTSNPLPDECLTTGEDGAFTFYRVPLTVILRASLEGYSDNEVEVGYWTEAFKHVPIPLTASVGEGEWRIVLSWDNVPAGEQELRADLDAHLWVPAAGEFYEVYHGDKGSCSSGPWACLDHNVISGPGSETVTIAKLQNGSYSYAVYWMADDASDNWASSQAHVRVYDSSGLVGSFDVIDARNVSGDPLAHRWWNVFTIENGSLVVKNELDREPPQPTVGP